MRKILIAITLAGMIGCVASCATQPVIQKPQIVEVPIKVGCKVEQPAPPAWPLDAMPADADIFVKAKTLIAEILAREGYEAELRAALIKCSTDLNELPIALLDDAATLTAFASLQAQCATGHCARAGHVRDTGGMPSQAQPDPARAFDGAGLQGFETALPTRMAAP